MLSIFVFLHKINPIPNEKIIERLKYENPWWISGNIPYIFKNVS